MVDPVDNPVVGAIPQDPRNPHLVKAGRVFHEVYTSEDTYLATLQLVIDQKQALVQDSSFKALKASEKKVIFKLINIIEQLQKTETKLLEAFLTLDELMNASPQDAAQIQAQLKSIEPLMASSMRLHAKYMEVHAVEFFPFIRSKFKSVVALEFNKQVNVASAFIQPVQRGPRYPILLREAIEPLEKLQRETNTPVQYINEIIQMDEQIKTRLKGANAQINARPLKELRRRIYQGNIALPVMKDYVANLKKKEVKEDELSVKETNLENLESNVNASQDSIQKLKKEIKGLQREIDAISDDLKKMVKDHTKLPKVHSAYMELDNNAMKLSAGSPAIDWPTFVERAVSTEPKPAVETSGNIQISLDISKGERKAVKSRLRNLDPDIMQVLPQGFQVVETQKELGIRTGFLVKDQAGINVLHIVVEKGEVRIRELKSGAVSEDAKLMMMHRLSEALKYQESQSTIISTDVDKIRRLNEISVNEGLPTYAQASEEKRALHKKIVNEGQSRTTGIVLREIDIQCKGNLPEDIKEKVQEVISQGLFVPHLKTDDKSPLPLLSGEVTIATEVPLLAIKQYEAALNAGLTPVFTQDAKKKVESFVKKQMEINNSDTQVAVNVPFESHSITGAQVLERVKRASKDGFILNLNSQAKKNLKEHIANLKPDNPSLQYDLPMKHSHVAAMVNNLLALGLSPDTQAFPKAK
ncbi:MAG: RhoGEF domain-containing protein, partial [Candidatus Berkiella sp.]